MAKKKFRIFAADFETTSYTNQEYTEVWAAAICELKSEDCAVHNNIFDFFQQVFTLDDALIYFHNLKFDGSFILHHLINCMGYKQALLYDGNNVTGWKKAKDLKHGEFRFSLSDRGQFYSLTMRYKKRLIEFRDSVKLLPFSLRRIGESFKTKHQKLELEYQGIRKAGGEISAHELEYIKNDVFVLKEALEIMFSSGNNKMTIGACCLAQYKETVGNNWETLFPNLYDFDDETGACSNAGVYIRKSYRGGWCYLKKGNESKIIDGGFTIDVNSLYPSRMHSSSGCRYPVGKPKWWTGDHIPAEAQREWNYFFVRIKTRFYLKEGMLPFIQLKGNLLYPPTENLTSSDVYNGEDGRYYREYFQDGKLIPALVTMTMTQTEYKLFLEHYRVEDFEILDGCFFSTRIGIFDEYINKHFETKMNSEGAVRELSKLFLNNLYGKMASNTDSSFKYAVVKENGVIAFKSVEQHDKLPGYIAVGSAITAYSREFTIRAAQKNYRIFLYADTDSLHCAGEVSALKGCKLHKSDLNCWKLENEWEVGFFVRQKTYIESMRTKDGELNYHITCAGMQPRCKEIFVENVTGRRNTNPSRKYTKRELEFLSTKMELTDFRVGVKIPGRLMAKRIIGGIVLIDDDFTMR